ncbi:MAG: hypothetical protein HYZ09_01295 [Candidatus Kerfeldbacteria bacterium]|nr:hypothetical protein [Candidatus Kerfeldbacteria bacterium]
MPEVVIPRAEVSNEQPSRPTIDSPERWEEFRAENLQEVIEQANQRELEGPSHLMWRSMDPGEILLFLEGQRDALHFRAHRPNVTTYWTEALGYRAPRSEYPFLAVIGFEPDEETMKVSREHMRHMADDTHPSVLEKASKYYILNGDVAPKDARYLLIRFAGKELGKPQPLQVYRVKSEALAALREAKRQTEYPEVA